MSGQNKNPGENENHPGFSQIYEKSDDQFFIFF